MGAQTNPVRSNFRRSLPTSLSRAKTIAHGYLTLSLIPWLTGGMQLTNEVTIEIDGQQRPACVAETISLIYK
ncbi:MAG TPA: hypothetical protein VMJ73_16145 [Rhizomicrobium sp.]|nr:hypothetical protein [Rhizomicrobium sp.]